MCCPIIASHRVSKSKIQFSQESTIRKHLLRHNSEIFLNLNNPELCGAVVNTIGRPYTSIFFAAATMSARELNW